MSEDLHKALSFATQQMHEARRETNEVKLELARIRAELERHEAQAEASKRLFREIEDSLDKTMSALKAEIANRPQMPW